jgi:hypothetical protein
VPGRSRGSGCGTAGVRPTPPGLRRGLALLFPAANALAPSLYEAVAEEDAVAWAEGMGEADDHELAAPADRCAASTTS